MKTAVIKAGGRQYVVSEGDTIKVDRMSAKEGKVTFDQVLFAATDKSTKLGMPLVSGAKVEGKVLGEGRHPKVVGVKMKAKKRNKKYFGHKQHYTEVEIEKISLK